MSNLQETSKVATDNERSADKLLIKALWPSILGIVICIILLCGTTFAWLTDSVHTGGSTLTAGHFSVDISVNDEAAMETPVMLTGGRTSTVEISKSENAVDGYAILTIWNGSDSSSSYLVEFDGSDSITVDITTPDDGTFSLRVVPYWGTNNSACQPLPVPRSIDLSASPVETASETTPETTPDNPSESASETTADNNENENGGQ